MKSGGLTYFYSENYLDYMQTRFGLSDCSYKVKNKDYEFIAPILHNNNGKVESGNLSYLSLPYVNGDISDKVLKKEMNSYLEKINILGTKRIAIRQDPLMDYNTQILKSILQNNFMPNLFYTTVIDLKYSQEMLWQNLRKSYKSPIHNLEKNNEYKFVIADQNNNIDCSDDWIDLYLMLVKRGGGNPERKKYENIKQSIIQGCAVLYLLYNTKGSLVSCVNISYQDKLAYYLASGTHPDFEGQDFYSHYLMWKAVLDLKSREFDFLEIGPVFYNNVKNFYNHSEKELAISDFKLGIGGKLTPFVIWEKIY